MSFLKSCVATKKRRLILGSLSAVLLLALLPLIIGIARPHRVGGGLRVKYLWGISTILESFGAEFAAFNMGRHAQKIQYDLKSFDIEFENDLESRLLVAHSRELGSNYAYVGNASIYYSEGYGAHRFFVPAGDLNDFTEAMRAYQEELEQMTKAEATGYNMEEVNLNKLLEWIANKEDLGYDYNPDLDDSFYSVSGWLSEVTEPMNQIGMLAKAYGLKFEVRDNTLRAW